MNRTARRKQLALFFCCGFAGALAGGYAGEAEAQASAPLRVDPVLLGLPPVTPAQAPEPAKKQESRKPESENQDSSSGSKGTAEVKPVEPAVVEARPVDSPSGADRSESIPVKPSVEPPAKRPVAPVPPAIPAKAPAVQEPVRQEVAAPVVSEPAPATPSRAPATPVEMPVAPPPVDPARSQAKVPAPVTAKTEKSIPVQAPADGKVSSMAPFRVDPALLGLPPAVPATQLAGRPAGAAGTSVAAAPSVVTSSAPSGALALPVVSPAVEEADPIRDAGPALALRASSKMVPLGRSTESRPAFLSAQRMYGEVNREFHADGEAELRKIGTVVNADQLTYWPLDDEVEANGNVRLEQGEDLISGPKARLRMEDQVGYFEQPTYILKHSSLTTGKNASDREESDRRIEELSKGEGWNSGFASSQSMSFKPGQTSYKTDTGLSKTTESRGEADRIDFEGENQYRLLNNTFTTCPVGNNDWYVRTDTLKLDYDREVGEGDNGTVYFMDVPILYSPWLSFSLNNERKSGLLAPSIGTSSDNGFEYEQPYYWNIAPNMDATISPRVMSKRGVQLNNEFRYLNTAMGGVYRGTLTAEYLPDDRLHDNDNRYGVSLLHNQTTNNGFTGLINYNKVSDDDYYTDLSSDIASTSQTQLLQQGKLTYSGGGWWNTSINFQQYQTLQPDSENPVLEQYRMLPQITVNARKPDFNLADLTFLGQYTNFTIREREQYGTVYPDGKRTVLYPQIALPYVTPGWYVTPKFGVNYRSYSLTGQESGISDSMSVSLPIFSLDSGMTFERPSNWFGRDYIQTLEPRLYYLNIPYKDQSDIPLFDTALADFNFAQIFSENQFSGWDRINNANQLTAGLTTRLIEPTTGDEIMRAMIGQRYYFTRTKVALSGVTVTSDTDKWDRSDFLAAFSGQVLPKVYVDTGLQFDIADSTAERYSVGLRYQPQAGKVLNASYRYNRDESSPIDQVDLSAQWPISGRWHAVGRFNYAFKDDSTVLSTSSTSGRVIQSLAGLEYNGGCWILRGVFRRQALTSEDSSTSFFVQLELSGLARIGSNPLSVLKKDIQGYSLINDSGAESVFGD